MEPWLLNWTAHVARNLQVEFDGISYDDGPEWFELMWQAWLANSDHGQKLKQEKALIEMMRLDEEAGLYDIEVPEWHKDIVLKRINRNNNE